MILESNEYHEVVDEHYRKQADEHELSLKSTMPDQNIRRLEITNLIKYLKEGQHCLEVGCGNGAASIEISKILNLDLFAIDYSKEMIDLANKQDTTKIKGKLNFSQGDVMNLKISENFDVVYTIRCIINLLNEKDQEKALENLGNVVKKGGKLILLEAFSDGLNELNQARSELELEPIPPAYHNLHLKKDLVVEKLKNLQLTLVKEDNFLSSYYFGTRVIYPALAKANNTEVKFNSKIDEFFSYLPACGNFAHIKMLIFEKN